MGESCRECGCGGGGGGIFGGGDNIWWIIIIIVIILCFFPGIFDGRGCGCNKGCENSCC